MTSKECARSDPTDPSNGQKDIYVQLVLSLALGLSAFLGFCFLRPRWKSLYAARKRQTDAAFPLPDLPDTFFGWIPVLYRVTEEQVLSTAGLDAFVFLSFFKMSMRLFGVMFVLAAAVLAPINAHFIQSIDTNSTSPSSVFAYFTAADLEPAKTIVDEIPFLKPKKLPVDTSYLWAYLVFTYVFTGLLIYFLTRETQYIIKRRQEYLGSQSTITDRTIKLSGVPPRLRSEEKIKEFFAKLDLGKVEKVTICRDWGKLDKLLEKRAFTLRRLEEAWTVHHGRQKKANSLFLARENPEQTEADNDDQTQESDALLGNSHVMPYDNPRPTTRAWYGFLTLRSKKVDAIDFYEEQLRKLDDKITAARKKEYTATSLAFVTMDSISACQTAVQAVLDPSPTMLQANLAPAPSDLIWANTYLPRRSRMLRAWTITIFIFVLTIVWLIPVAAIAGLLDLCTIRQVWPQLADLLERHEIIMSLVQTGLPTLIVSLLNLAVPFLYDYLANMQGSISQADVELSVISKNFYFIFFNVFLVFTVFGTASKFWPVLRDSLRDTTKIAYQLAQSVQSLSDFYKNFILLQSIGLLPFRLLEAGSVFLYPFALMGAKTPRDYAELVRPPIFQYGFYLPSAILIFILCLVYSILPSGYLVLFFGLIYFIFGYYTYKYQLLYAMDHPQHSTGGAWPMIVYRVLIGLAVFQVTMAGLIALKNEFWPAALATPLIPCTIWYSYYFSRAFEPLTKFIALNSIQRETSREELLGRTRRRRSATIDESREEGLEFVNPSLTVPLENIWVNTRPNPDGELAHSTTETSVSSSLSLGDTHIWRDSGDANDSNV